MGIIQVDLLEMVIVDSNIYNLISSMISTYLSLKPETNRSLDSFLGQEIEKSLKCKCIRSDSSTLLIEVEEEELTMFILSLS